MKESSHHSLSDLLIAIPILQTAAVASGWGASFWIVLSSTVALAVIAARIGYTIFAERRSRDRIAAAVVPPLVIALCAWWPLTTLWKEIDDHLTVGAAIRDLSQVGTHKLDLSFYFVNRSARPWLITEIGVAQITTKDSDSRTASDRGQLCRSPEMTNYLPGWKQRKSLGAPSTKVWYEKQALFIAGYLPTASALDGTNVPTPVIGIEPGKIRSLLATFDIDVVDRAQTNVVVLCPILSMLGSGWAVCPGWTNSQLGPGILNNPSTKETALSRGVYCNTFAA
jgi:hypothetical protein